MAQTENGVGISFKLPDGTMVWARRDEWAILKDDIKVIVGEERLAEVQEALRGARTPRPTISVSSPVAKQEEVLTPEQAAEELGGGSLAPSPYQTCPRCGSLKNKLVPAGVSSKTGKPYKAFHACPSPGCPGR